MHMKRTLKPLLTWAALHPSSTQISMVPKAFSFVTRSGHQLNSILLTLHGQGLVVKSALSQTHSQGSCQMFMMVSWDRRIKCGRHTWWCPFSPEYQKICMKRAMGTLEGRCVSSKSPSKVRDGDEGAAGRNGREKFCAVNTIHRVASPPYSTHLGKKLSFQVMQKSKVLNLKYRQVF